MTVRSSDSGQPPELAVVSGNPSPDQIAALVTVLSALARSGGPVPRREESGRSEWSARYRLLREPLARAPGGWRASALPR
ncbi:MAG TPA: acyl-CoA carboxylase subunit epsilon [Streptosporangiaceae bacterium]|nr:acyl-CoA carboxylase subunit epsilon [Streptosporangiaceae bacterium]